MAGNAELKLEIGLVDKASKGLSKISDGLGSLGRAAGGLALGGLGAATVGVGALGAALAGGISDAREANLVMAQTEAVIKSTGGAAGFTAEQIAAMAGSLSAAEGKSLFGDSDIQKGQNLLLTFTNIKETLPEATQVMLDMATAMGTDAEGGAIQLGKALNDPIAGISALSRVGVTFSEEQKAMIDTMMQTGNVAGAQRIILAELNKEFGGSAAAAAAADGGMAMFKDRMGELAESVGAQVLPALNSLLSWLNSPDVQAGIEAVVNGLVNGFKGFVDWFTVEAMPILRTVFEWLSTVALPAVQGAFEVAWPIIKIAVAGFVDWFRDTAWPALQVAFNWIKDTGIPAVQAAFEVAWPIIKSAVQTTWDYLQTTVFPNAKIMFGELMETVALVRDKFIEVWPKIKGAVEAVYNFILNTMWPNLKDIWADWMVWQDDMQAKFEVVWPKIKSAVSTVYEWITGTFIPGISTAFNNLKTWIGEVRDRWNSDIDAIKGFVQGLKDKVDTVKQGISDAITAIKGFFTNGWETVKSTIKGVFDTIGGYISGPIETAKTAVSTAIRIITDTIQGAIDLVNGLIGLINRIPALPNLPSIPGLSGRGAGVRVPWELPGASPDTFRQVDPGTASRTTLAGGGTVVNIDARGSTDPRGVQSAVDRAFRSRGIAADIRLRTT